MSDTGTRSVAEIMWTSEPCCNVQDNNGHCPDDCRIWTSPDGLRWEYGPTLDVDVTPDDMLTWLREQRDIECVGIDAVDTDPRMLVRVWFGHQSWPEQVYGDTLHAALEAAVRAVAEAGR